jgi:hypothetical protein
MSIKFNPSQNNIQLNGKDFDFFLDKKNNSLNNSLNNSFNNSFDDCFVDMYVMQLNDNSDYEILKLLKNDIPNINAKLTIIDRKSQKEIVKEYKDGVNISKPYYGSNDMQFFFLDEITNKVNEVNVDKICLNIYKKYIEKMVLTRSNKFCNNDYLFDVYLIFSNTLYKEIYDKIKFYFEETIKSSNIKLHLVYIIPKNNEYIGSCIVS